jgi:co-chaperonin GroES (HSP10)
MTIVPCGHRILVKPERVEDTDPAYKAAKALGFEFVDKSLKQEQAAIDKGVVIAIGPTAFKDYGGDAWCAVGDRIAFAKYGGKFVTPDALILNDEDVVCVLKD